MAKHLLLKINRRRFIRRASLLTLGLLLVSRTQAQTANPPVSVFNKESTAEQVTAGLNLSGKMALVTGANSGLGFETARVLALRGAHVIVVARTLAKAKDACQKIQGLTTPVVCELTDFNSVVACSDQVIAMNLPLDILVCNAGIMELPELQQVRGLEKQFVVNYLGHFLLTQRLLETVKAAPQGRLIMLSSGRYKSAPAAGIEFDNLSGERNYDPLRAYGQSKLAMAIFSRELSKRLQDTRVTAAAVLPGVIMTNLGRHYPRWKILLAKAIGWTFMRSVEAGAATSCYTSTHPSLAKVSGHYFKDSNTFIGETQAMYDDKLSARLWDESIKLTENYL